MNFKVSMLDFSGNPVSSGFPRWQCVLRNRCLRPKILVLSFLFSRVNLAEESNVSLGFRNTFRGKVKLEENHDNSIS